jgi:hypothetical protein
MIRCLVLASHCDDEILGQGAFTLDMSIERKVLVVSSDRLNPTRQSYRRGEEALAAVCADLGVKEHRALSQFHSEFSRLRTRGPGDGPILMDWWRAASAALLEMEQGCDFVAVDGPWGHYSHLDHLLLRRMVLSTTRLPVRWTTARYETSTWPIGNLDRLMPKCELVQHVEVDPDLFEQMRQHYVTRGAWTWDHPAPLSVDIYEERA